MELDPSRINQYTIDELMAFLDSGEYVFEEIQQCGLRWDKQAELKERLAEREKVVREKAAQEQRIQIEIETAWEETQRSDTLTAYQNFYNKYKDSDNAQAIRYCTIAKMRIETKEGEISKARQDLLKDMREKTWNYNTQELIRNLVNGVEDEVLEAIQDQNDPASRFLKTGQKLKYEDLVAADIVPKSITLHEILASEFTMPQTNISALGEFPKDRTDIFFLGVPKSGKTSVLSGIIYQLWKNGSAGYVPQIVDGRDPCQSYYQGLIRAIGAKKPPMGTQSDTISFMKVDICNTEKNRKNEVTIVEMSGEAFREAAEQAMSSRDAEASLGALKCLHNDNPKLLFFVVDFSIVKGLGDTFCTATRQSLILDSALTLFTNDGPDQKSADSRKRNCTMSKVDTVAIIVTKSDLMDAKDPEEQYKEAKRYLDDQFPSFMTQLGLCCEEYDINQPNKNEPYILTFSLGKFYIGNTVKFDKRDSEEIIEFISTTTRSKKLKKKFGLF